MAEPQSVGRDHHRFVDDLKTQIPAVTWQTWFAPMHFEADDEVLSVVSPSDLHSRWIQDKHHGLIESMGAKHFGPEMALEYRVGELHTTEIVFEDPDVGVPDSPTDLAYTPTRPDGVAAVHTDRPRFLGKYVFDNFIVGQSNRFAWAAAMAVSEKPGEHYNPLFIYGGAGLGKTHLLHAVGQHTLEMKPNAIVRYVTSENFFNQFIDGIRRKRMNSFKTRYRTTDVLLLDDVQFFEGKEQILEEFFHTFNSLYESGKQMVIGSDRPPKHLATLEDRLRSRFEWGLMTDIQPPDVETRLAILRKNADFAPTPVPEDVLEFIARHVPNNIRELEGALTRVTAYAALTSQQATLDLAHEILRDLLPSADKRPPTGEEILTTTAAAFGFSTEDMKGPSRRQPLVLARQIAMYLCRELTDLSLPKIGKLFGGRDHTTVLHAVDKVTRLLPEEEEVFEHVANLSQALRKTR